MSIWLEASQDKESTATVQLSSLFSEEWTELRQGKCILGHICSRFVESYTLNLESGQRQECPLNSLTLEVEDSFVDFLQMGPIQ